MKSAVGLAERSQTTSIGLEWVEGERRLVGGAGLCPAGAPLRSSGRSPKEGARGGTMGSPR